MNASPRVYVIGVGMTKFEKPGRRENFDYPDMAKEAVDKALTDARLGYASVQQAVCGYVYGDSTCGQRALYQIGLTGIPVVNVNNNCSTGSTALYLAAELVRGGRAACVLALGFEKMQRGSLGQTFSDRASPLERHVEVLAERHGLEAAPIAAQMFGAAGREHMKMYGTTPEHFAKIAAKNHRHSANNPNSQFTDVYSVQEILSSQPIYAPLTKLQCCPTSDGAAAAVLASEEFVLRYGLQAQAVELLAVEMATDLPSVFNDKSAIKMVGYDMTIRAAQAVYAKTGLRPDQFQVVELHDCFSANELLTYEALGLCPPGKAGELVDRGDNTYGGKFVVNPSGGLISKGHPLGATGLAQCTELCWQLRGLAGPRQVPGCRRALQHNIGLGGAVVVAAYQLGFPEAAVTAASVAGVSAGDSQDEFQSAKIFRIIGQGLETEGEQIVKKVNGVFAFKVTGGPGGKVGLWLVDCKNGRGKVEFNGQGKADVTITISDQDLVQLMLGKLNPQQAFFSGKLKMQGNMGLAMKLREFQSRVGELKAKL
uniref:Sterol carrier protein 2 n=1 Tax=Macrostomum lignano TaxID=282301 RepID=A0A1I8GZW3_9PLAT